MKVLVTRPAEDGAEIARSLARMGHEALLVPLLMVEFLEGEPLKLQGVQAILATSANGVRAVAARTRVRDLPLFAVGPQTAAAAAKAGFIRVRNAAGDAGALAERVPDWADPAEGILLHVRGEDAGGELARGLEAKGFRVRSEVLYRVRAAREFPVEAADLARWGQAQAALFFSPRSAKVFAECVTKAGLSTKSLIAVCISRNTADALQGLDFSEVRIAAAPNQADLLVCL
jgi:uroporphyrinogen-III synthase